MSAVRGLHRTFSILRSNNLGEVLPRPWESQIFMSLHRTLSSVSGVGDSPSLVVGNPSGKVSGRVQVVSKAMKAYLERAKAHEEFISEKNHEFEIGKRHLANMMGVEVESLTQENIDRAIEYLMPSGLYEKKARPMMKTPKELFPREKAAQFDVSGRPFNCFFYTRRANFYEAMHHIVDKFTELDEFEDKMLRRGISKPPDESRLYLGGSRWLEFEEVRKMFLEAVRETEYKLFVDTLNRLCAHPYAFRCKDFIFKFREVLSDIGELETIPELIQDENGRLYVTAESKRKTVTSKVTVWGDGEGKVKINGFDINYFTILQDKEQIMYPLQFTGLLGKVDFEATVEGSGHSAQAGAIRHALSLCLRSFVSPEEVERMRLAGLLTRDRRKRQRKKPGQEGARRKFAWRKR